MTAVRVPVRARAVPVRLTAPLLAATGILSALAVGARIGTGDLRALAATLGLVAAPVVLADLALGLALWAPLPFLSAVPGFYGAELAASALIALAWVGALAGGQHGAVTDELTRHRIVLVLVAGLALWLGLSAIWAGDGALVAAQLWKWYPSLLLFAIVATTLTDERGVCLLACGLLAGALASVAIGFGYSELTDSHPSVDRSHVLEGRLHGAEVDANVLAAALVPAVALAGGLAAVVRGRVARGALLAIMAFLAVGILATKSRGGLIAAAVVVVAAAVVMRGRRRLVAVLSATLVAVLLATLAASPGAYTRLLDDQTRAGSGRADIWRVAFAVYADHPVLGVGLGNYAGEAPTYARDVGPVAAEMIAERTAVVHGAFLDVAVEAGAVGLVLFLAVIGLCLRASWRAGNRFDAQSEPALATFARAVLVAQAGTLTALLVLSAQADKRLWALLALGPALDGVAARRARVGPPSRSGAEWAFGATVRATTRRPTR